MTTDTKFLVTSSTGKTGYNVAKILLEKGHKVRIMSRRRSKKVVELEKMGAEVALGHLNNEQDLTHTLSGIQRVYYCHPIVPGILHNTALFANVAKQMGVETVVNVGQYLSKLDMHPSRSTQEHKQAYFLLDNADIGAIHVTPGWFADNVFAPMLFISQLGRFPFPLGDGKSPVVSSEDIARVSAALLVNPEGHEGKHYQPTGPKAVSYNDMLDIFSKVLGRKVKPLPMSTKMFFKATTQMGMHPYTCSQLDFYLKDFQNNVFNYEPTDVVERFTGQPAEDFETVARRYFKEAGAMKKTVSGQWQAFKQFMEIGFTKGPTNKEMALMNN